MDFSFVEREGKVFCRNCELPTYFYRAEDKPLLYCRCYDIDDPQAFRRAIEAEAVEAHATLDAFDPERLLDAIGIPRTGKR